MEHYRPIWLFGVKRGRRKEQKDVLQVKMSKTTFPAKDLLLKQNETKAVAKMKNIWNTWYIYKESQN